MAVDYVVAQHATSQRRACQIVRQHRSGQRYHSCKDPKTALRARMRELSRIRMRYGYRRLHVLESRLDLEDRARQGSVSTPEIDKIDNAVSRIKVPLNYSDQYYDLRQHIELVRQRLANRQHVVRPVNASEKAAAEREVVGRS